MRFRLRDVAINVERARRHAASIERLHARRLAAKTKHERKKLDANIRQHTSAIERHTKQLENGALGILDTANNAGERLERNIGTAADNAGESIGDMAARAKNAGEEALATVGRVRKLVGGGLGGVMHNLAWIIGIIIAIIAAIFLLR